MKAFFSTLLGFSLCASAFAFEDKTPAVPSARIDGPEFDRVLDSVVDNGGNTYVVGSFNSPQISFQTFTDDDENGVVSQEDLETQTSAGDNDIFVAKYNAAGGLVWARRAGGSGSDVGTGIVVDDSNNVYISGYFSGTANIGGTTLTAELQTVASGQDGAMTATGGFTMGNELFVAMLDSSGVWQWARKLEYTIEHEALKVVREEAKVNFMDDDDNATERNPAGWKLDVGNRYSSTRGHGWNRSDPDDDLDNFGGDDDDVDGLDEYIHTRGYSWQYDLESYGFYEVEIQSWDTNHRDSYYHTTVDDANGPERTDVIRRNVEALNDSSRITGKAVVEIRPFGNPDLHLRDGSQADNNKISWVKINKMDLGAVDAGATGELRLQSGDFTYPGKGLAIDGNGNLYLKGFFMQMLGSDSTARDWRIYLRTATGDRILLREKDGGSLQNNSFVTRLKINPIGDPSDPSAWGWDWMKMHSTQFGSETRISDISADSTGKVLTSGVWSGRMSATPSTSSSHGSAFAVRQTTSTGDFSGFLRIDGNQTNGVTTNPTIESIVSDSSGNLYVMGNFSGRKFTVVRSGSGIGRVLLSPADPGLNTTGISGDREFFIAKASFNSEWEWIKSPGGSGGSVGYDLTIDAGGNIFATGALSSGSMTLGSTTLTQSAAGRYEAFAAKLDTSAQAPVWESAILPNGNSRFYGSHISVAPTGILSWIVSTGADGNFDEFIGGSHRFGSRSNSTNQAFDTLTKNGSLFYSLDLNLEPAENLNTTGLTVGSVIPVPENLLPDGAIASIKFFIGGNEILDWQKYIHWDSFSRRFIVVSAFANGEIRFFSDDFSVELGPFPLSTRFPTDDDPPESFQLHVTGENIIESTVELQPAGATHTFSQILFTTNGAAVSGNRIFSTQNEGWSTLLYTEGSNTTPGNAPVRVIPVRTLSYTTVPLEVAVATVGKVIDPRQFDHWNTPDNILYPGGYNPSGKSGFVALKNSPYDGAGPDAAYDRSRRTGRIIPVNTASPSLGGGDLIVIWDGRDRAGINVAWPTRAVRYTLNWPTNPERIVITSGLGSEMELQGEPELVSTSNAGFSQFPIIAINCGGGAYTDSAGVVYDADRFRNGGSRYTITNNFAGTVDDVLYQSQYYALPDFSYEIPLPNGSYEVTLKFGSDTNRDGIDVSLEGTNVIDNLSIEDAGGILTAIDRTFSVDVDDGALTIDNTVPEGSDYGILSAIVVKGQPKSFGINSGGRYQLSSSGVPFLSDQFSTGSIPVSVNRPIANTSDENLYQSLNSGTNPGYAIPVANGTYEVTVFLADLNFADPGERLFQLNIEGLPVFEEIDVAALSGGIDSAFSLTASADVSDGVLNLETVASLAAPIINAVSLRASKFPIHINAGGPGITISGTDYIADRFFTSGFEATPSTNEILGTDDDALYQTGRSGSSVRYAIAVPRSSFYDVTLRFAETAQALPGLRRFAVVIEGQTVETSFDPITEGGSNTAIERTYRVAVADDTIDISLNAESGSDANISSISVFAATASGMAVNCGGPQVTIGGKVFAADTAFTGGSPYEDASDENGVPVLTAPDEAIYRTGRAGTLVKYALPTGDGAFNVTLHFSERELPATIDPDDGDEVGTEVTQPDPITRAATITLEGKSIETSFQILAEAGTYNQPLTMTYSTRVIDGVLNLSFSAPSGFNEAQINAISVTPALLIEQEKINPAKFRQARIYHQPVRDLPGYNPNEEHALLAPSQSSQFNAVFALRSDLNHYGTQTSDPYVLLKYQDGTNGDQWAFKVYKVSLTDTVTVGATDHVFDFGVFTGFAGKRVQPPYPLSILPAQEETERGEVASGLTDGYWEDHKGAVWARSAGQIVVKYYYPLLPDFWYDLDGGGNSDNATNAPWLEFVTAGMEPGNGTPAGQPIKTVYNIEWPPFTPELFVGETLRQAKRGLPGIIDWAAAAIVYDDNEDALPLEPGDTGVQRPLTLTARIIDSMSSRQVTLQGRINGENFTSRDGSIDYGIKMELAEAGQYAFKEFPPHLKLRMRYDPINERLHFRGFAGGPNPSTPIEMLNVMSSTEKAELLALGQSAAWSTAINQLFDLTRNPNGIDRTKIGNTTEILAGIQHRLIGSEKQDDVVPENVLASPALTAGLATGTGYMTLAENNDPSLGAAPVALHVIKVVQPAGRGSLRLILPDNPLDEKVTLRHSLDFAGDPDQLFFEWYYKPAIGSGRPTTTPDGDGSWLPLETGRGLNSITIEGSGLLTLSDNWIFCRYRAADGVTGTLYPQNPDYSGFAGDPSFVSVERPMFVPGWIKRVLEGINPFEQRFRDFHQSPTQTYITMLQQVGPPFEGAVALNGDPDFLNSVGLLQLYETVLRRGMDLSINGIPNQSHDGTNTALLLAASRIADMYMLVGNEAFADAQDPTIGFNFGAGGDFGTISTSSFAFENVLPSLLSEELALLRGRDQSLAGTELGPVFNRLYWNFSSGLEGEPAYALNYQVTDVNGVSPTGGPTGNPDGFIRELDAATLYPQGHGDAWGHYLSAIKTYYRLLRHHKFTWSTRAEYTLISGVPHAVDYLDEVKFARAAAARTHAGEAIVDLTYRDQYTADPAGQWQGYKDTQEDTIPAAVPDEVAGRNWGVDEWARRSGQGALLDWVVANAIIPEEDVVDETETQVNDALGTGSTPVAQFNQSSIDKIDRTTVGELLEIASGFTVIESLLDKADRGLNPLGLHEDVTPFDVDPAINEVGDDGERSTHFEQIFTRTKAAVINAKNAFEHANGLTERLRQLRIDSDDFQRESEDSEFDFKNRMIEIFGYPYAGHIGPGKPYPDGYDGPDLYMYNYVDVAEINGDAENLAIQEPVDSNSNGVIDSDEISDIQNQFDTFSGFFQAMDLGVADGDSGIQDTIAHYFPEDVSGGQSTFSGEPLRIDYQLSTRRWAFHAQNVGERRAEGTLQLSINNMLQAEGELVTAISNYGSLISEINDSIDLLEAQHNLESETIQILTDRAAGITSLNVALGVTNTVKAGFEQTAEAAKDVGDVVSDALPKFNVFGTSNGVDAFAAARGLVRTAAHSAEFILRSGVIISEGAIQSMEFAKEETELWTDITIEKAGFEFEVQERLKELEQTMRNEVTTRLELFNLEQALRAAVSEYKATLAEGQRVMQERIIARRRLAGPVQQLRYQDIAFRNFRNEALQRYKAAFDVAAQYVFIAAKVYDYETTLLNSSSQSGQSFLTNIIKQRSIGLFEDGIAVHGVDGLSDPMARMSANFRVLKGQLGFNNPQIETGQFSLRHELFRMRDSSEEAWQKVLAGNVVENLWDLPEFRRYCRPFAPEEAGAQPGIVIEFSTTVTFGLNFFGWPLAGGDSSYDSANFATKILGSGLWFENYNGHGLANTPRAYLVPVGLDVQRSPTFDSLATREFNVVDQVLPVPFPIGNAQLTDPNYIPRLDSLDNSFAQVRRFSRFRAYHDDPDIGNDEFPTDELEYTTRLVGRSVWNTRWMLIIPGGTFLNDADEGIQTFIFGQKIPGSSERDGNGITDIQLFFQTYAYSGI